MHPWLALLLALFSAPAAARPAEREIRVVVFGRTGGVSGHVGDNRAHLVLYDLTGTRVEEVRPIDEGPSVFAADGRLLFRPGGLSIEAFRRFLAAGPHTRAVLAEAWPIKESPFEVLFEHPAAADTPALDLLDADALPGLHASTGRHVRYTAADGASVEVLELPDASPDAPLQLDADLWELRFAFEGDVVPAGGEARRLFNVGRPMHDGARRVAAISALREADPEGTLVLAAGDDIEDYSFVATGKPDLQRPNTWRSFQRIGLTALVVGRAEAATGLVPLLDEASAAGVTLLAANLGGIGPSPMPPWKLVPVRGVQILIVGLLDPKLPVRSRLLGFEGRPITSPVDALASAVEQATASLGRRPDVVIGLGLLSPETRADVASRSPVVDLLLADFDDHGVSSEQTLITRTTVGERMLHARAPRAIDPGPAGRRRLGVVSLHLVADAAEGPFRLIAAHSEPRPITGDQPPDPETLRAVQQVRQAAYAPAQVAILPDLAPAVLADSELRTVFDRDMKSRGLTAAAGRITATLWRQLATNVLRDRYDAEVAVLPRLPFPWTLMGPVTRLEGAANLNVPDEVVLVSLTPAQISALVGSPVWPELVTAGIDPAGTEEGPTVLGRSPDARERFVVVTTDTVLIDPRLAAVFEAAPVHIGAGASPKIRDVVLDDLTQRGAAGDEPRLVRLMRPGGLTPESRWVLDFKAISLEASSYSVYGPQAKFANVPETRVTTASNVALAARGDVFVRRDGRSVDWVNQGHFAFAETRFAAADDLETADALAFSSELRVGAWGLGGPSDGVPFLRGSYATEFTPTPDNPRKKRTEGALGLLWSGDGLLRSARVATVAARDFSQDNPDPELGFLGAAELAQPLSVLVWSLTAEGRYYLPDVGQDTDRELGTVIAARTALDAPAWGALSLGIFFDVYAWRGQVEATRELGASLISGLALKYDRMWKPAYEPF